jgi:hypothetical protein
MSPHLLPLLLLEELVGVRRVGLRLQEEEEEEVVVVVLLLLLLRGLFKARLERRHAKSKIRSAPVICQTLHTSHFTLHTSHVTRHTSHVTRHTSHVTRHASQAFYANHNRKRGALRKENMRSMRAPAAEGCTARFVLTFALQRVHASCCASLTSHITHHT